METDDGLFLEDIFPDYPMEDYDPNPICECGKYQSDCPNAYEHMSQGY